MKPCPFTEVDLCWACWHNAPLSGWHFQPMPCPHEITWLKEYEWMGLTRPVVSSPNGGEQGGVTEGMLAKKAPTLLAMLQDTKYDDGSARQTSTLLIFVEAGMVKGCLNDREIGQTLWATGDSLEGLLTGLEARLAKGTGEWRPGGQGKGKRGR